jgi:hypothetical protein
VKIAKQCFGAMNMCHWKNFNLKLCSQHVNCLQHLLVGYEGVIQLQFGLVRGWLGKKTVVWFGKYPVWSPTNADRFQKCNIEY